MVIEIKEMFYYCSDYGSCPVCVDDLNEWHLVKVAPFASFIQDHIEMKSNPLQYMRGHARPKM